MGVNGKGARQKGHRFELWIINILKQYGYKAVSSRSESKNLDDKGVDIVDNTNFYIQCKHVERMKESYHDILNGMPTEKTPVVIHKRNNKGSIVAMKLTDFQDLLLFQKDFDQ